MRIESKRWLHTVYVAFLAIGCCLVPTSVGHAQTQEQQIIDDAAAALGGRDRVLAVKTLLLEGGGSQMTTTNLRHDDLGYSSAINQLRDVKRAYDLANHRSRFEATSQGEYAFYVGDPVVHQIQGLDGTVAFNVTANGNAVRAFGNQANGRRIEYLRHPLTLVRAALDSSAKLSNARTQGAERLVDITIAELPTLTLAVNASTKLPTRVIQMIDSVPLGDTALALAFSDYQPFNGIQIPTRLTTWTDNWVTADMRIHKVTVDGDVGDLAAPAGVIAAKPRNGAGAPEAFPTEAKEIAKGVWFVTGTTHHSLIVEFKDHLMVVEAPNNERVAAVWAKAKELRPNKPITTLLVTHHHFDHTAGVRDAIARGVTEIIAQENNLTFLHELLKRPHTINPDMLAKNPNSKPVKITTIKDTGVIKDSSMTVNLYHILDNSHSDSMLMIYFPEGRILTQADVYMPHDARHIIPGEPLGHAPWNRNLMTNIDYRKLQVDYHAPLHGDYVPQSTFIENTITMTQYMLGEDPKPERGQTE